jgi:hypothetical protein
MSIIHQGSPDKLSLLIMISGINDEGEKVICENGVILRT